MVTSVDADGLAPQGMTYDAAGNLTYDGVYGYAYDAWNRLITVTKAFRESSDASGDVTLGSVQYGSVVSTMTYDAPGRRVRQQVTNSGYLDATYDYYFRGQSVVEVRNGSDLTLKQYVWASSGGGGYIDELVQIAINDDPLDEGEQVCESVYFAMQDANFNVLGVVDASGDLVERYEYTPYGQRTVYFSPGSNDPDAYAPTQLSRRVQLASVDQPYGLCEVGHQGLMHDESIASVYNRARQLHNELGRFMQRDPLGYVDGMSAYQYVRTRPTQLRDATGRYTLNGATQQHCEELASEQSFDSSDDYFAWVSECVASTSIADRFELWYQAELADMSWLANLPDCPTKLKIGANGKPCNCNNGQWDGVTEAMQSFHPGAAWCMRTSNSFGPAQQCCYDSNGLLLTEPPAAGTPDRVASSVFNLYLGHWGHDVVPYNTALDLDGGDEGLHTDKYYKVRPPNQGGGACYTK